MKVPQPTRGCCAHLRCPDTGGPVFLGETSTRSELSIRHTEIDLLMQRVSLLERSNRGLKQVGAVVLIVLAAVILMAQAAPNSVAKVVEAEQFIVRDTGGKQRGSLGVAPDGAVRLSLLDRDEKRLARLSVLSDGLVQLGLGEDNGNPYIGLSLSKAYQGLSLTDADGIIRAQLSVLTKSTIGLTDKAGRKVVLGMTPEGWLSLGLGDREGNPISRIVLAMRPDGTPHFALEANDQIVWRAR